jgi:hypothetical protein
VFKAKRAITAHEHAGIVLRAHNAERRDFYECYPERFAQQALGHNSKAVHHAYSKQAEVSVPSLDDWQKELGKNLQRCVQATTWKG